jgi:hypothetical protein
MAKFKCSKCDKELELMKHSMKIVDGSIVSPEATCCDEYMKTIKENGGLGGIIKRPGGRIRGKF